MGCPTVTPTMQPPTRLRSWCCPREEPYKELRVGFGHDGEPLEIVLVNDPDGSGELVLVHAMRLRKTYYPLLPGQRRGRT